MKCNNHFYTSGSLSKEVMGRYIEPFGDITLVTRCKEVDSVNIDLEPSSIENTNFVPVPDYKAIKKIHNYFKARKIIKQEILKAEHIVLRTSSFANIAARYAKKFNKPYLVEVVGCAWDASWNYSLLGKIIAPFSFVAQRKTVKEADFAVFVTEKFLQKRYSTKGKSTNCSNVALTSFDDSTLNKRLDKINSLERNNRLVIGTTAAVDVKYKGQQYIIQALGKLKEEGVTRFEYQIVGDGDQTYLKSVADKYNVSEHVKFLGSLTHKSVFKWLDTIDIYAQPSRQEGLPRALIEAMSRAIPAIGAKTAGIPELIDPRFLFENSKDNIDEISSILNSISKPIMLEQSERNYGVSKKYDKKIIEKRRSDFFREYKNY